MTRLLVMLLVIDTQQQDFFKLTFIHVKISSINEIILATGCVSETPFNVILYGIRAWKATLNAKIS